MSCSPRMPRGFQAHEVDSIYAQPDDRYVVSLIVTYEDGRPDGADSPYDAVAAALRLVAMPAGRKAMFIVYDRVTQTSTTVTVQEALNGEPFPSLPPAPGS